jgi:hypothetical protein
MIDHRRDDLDYLPCDTELPHADSVQRLQTEAPAVADVGHLPRKLYTINSNRSRHQIIADYAATHDLTAKQVDELVKQLPDYGVRSMLHASLAVLRPRSAVVVSMAAERAARTYRGKP